MTHESFTEWVEIACTVLGSGDRFRETLLANADVFIDDWHATLPELGDCLHRLVAEGRVPKWPNQLTNAIRAELMAIRQAVKDAAKEEERRRSEAELRKLPVTDTAEIKRLIAEGMRIFRADGDHERTDRNDKFARDVRRSSAS